MIQYKSNGHFLPTPYTATGFFYYVLSRPLPREGNCPVLFPIDNQQNRFVPEHKCETFELRDERPLVYRAGPLSTCACVIYISKESIKIHIHHAMSGILYEEDIDRALNEMEVTDNNSVYVIFAHPGEPETYQDSLELLAAKGIPEDQILEITNGPGNFGVNSLGQIGG